MVACSTYRERRAAYSVSVGKYQGKRTIRRPRRRWEDNRWFFRNWGGRVWIGLT